MKILVLGGSGMLGHQLLKQLAARHEVRVTLKRNLPFYERFGLFDEHNSYDEVNLGSYDQLIQVMADFKPDAVINAAGIIKQRDESKLSIPSIEINSLLPHRLAMLCKAMDSRLIHISTDCVFSGSKGYYSETDPPDPTDVYGRSKLLGEVYEPTCLTIRTSMIGLELLRKKSLLEWFLAQEGPISGYKHAIFSGFTTLELCRILERLLVEFPEAHGLYHVSADAISKFDLLTLIRNRMGLNTSIMPEETVRCDRSLNSALFRRQFNYEPPSFEEMIGELCKSNI